MRRLTDVTYWDENWWKRERPRRLWLYRDFEFETVRLLRSPVCGGPFRVLEIGAGGSRLLPYLRRKYGYEALGTDFSLSGCLLLRANLALDGLEGSVVCEDLFLSSFRPETFDLVYSSGLIEHFDDTRAVIQEHLRMVKPGGRLVLIVPNLQGIQGKIVRCLAPSLWSRHWIFGPVELTGVLESFGLEQLRSGYLGSFYLHIGCDREWSGTKTWPGWLRWGIHASVRFANALISFSFRLSPLRLHTRPLSPAFFAAGTKPSV